MRSIARSTRLLLVLVCSCGDGGADQSEAGTASDAASEGTTPATTAGSETTDVPPAPTGDADVISLGAFVLETAADDPFEDRPADDACALGYGLEDGLFEVDTELCLYGAFSQPSLVEVRAGDTLEAVIVHDALYSEEAGVVAHLGVALGTEIGWETTLDIPSDAGFLRPTWTAAADAPAGTPVHYHVHNHGLNSYRLVAIKVSYQ